MFLIPWLSFNSLQVNDKKHNLYLISIVAFLILLYYCIHERIASENPAKDAESCKWHPNNICAYFPLNIILTWINLWGNLVSIQNICRQLTNRCRCLPIGIHICWRTLMINILYILYQRYIYDTVAQNSEVNELLINLFLDLAQDIYDNTEYI